MDRVNRRATGMGEGIMTIYRIVLISLIAFVVLMIAFLAYEYHLDVKDIESVVLATQVAGCLAPDGAVNLDDLKKVFVDSCEGNSKCYKKDELLFYCGFSGNMERIYVDVKVYGWDDRKVLRSFSFGDSGLQWVKAVFEREKRATKDIAKFEPGHIKIRVPIKVISDKKAEDGKIDIEVIVADG